ncbi:hydrogenase maturation protein HypF [Spirosoma lacussanchae]|uniref:carbamoyltransferase HypF n=1 Tax=Spirosoma lacussanchae TaxID=1884249 RepID=UPI0011089B23|nr:carbamoyltransferase HypF [Spirosoma lacussanchae]
MTFHLHITGLVQGVGFRPFVWQLARAMSLTGTVSNGPDGVHVYLNADAETAQQFKKRIQAEAPELARIQSIKVNPTTPLLYPDFSIIHSRSEGQASLLLTPDLALCDTCRTELMDSVSRRFNYAFTTCTHCGPRYSISHALPYDRPATTMADFGMCAACEAEYHDPANRRYYAQTNSCPDCAVTMSLYDQAGQCVSADQTTVIEQAVAQIKAGHTVAVKGIGGYLLLCDAASPDAIAQLRRRKHRPTKPLAVMYPSAEAIRQDCSCRTDELSWLQRSASPIVLLDILAEPASQLAWEALAPGLGQLGVLLPYAPLLALLAQQFNRPLVATSGNISGSPIAYTDEQATGQLPAVADYVLTHNRTIMVPQDDSVVRLSRVYRQPIMIRRSRGFAPTFLGESGATSANILALGASLKGTFAWQLRGNTYISQYLGDLESYDTQTNFRATLHHFLRLFDARPDRLVADQHDGYFSTQLARELAAGWGIPLTLVQHHEAHLAAVLAENDLLTIPDPVLGVIWDGTGYGTDGQIWGGEFMSYQDGIVHRVTHFDYFPALLGDKMPREPRLSALSLAYEMPGAAALLHQKFTPAEWTLYHKMLPAHRLSTSSVGRLFDAVAALVGLADRVSYEGEAALLLEEQAGRYVRQYGFRAARSYLPVSWAGPTVPTRSIIGGVIADVLAGKPTAAIAARFHATLVATVSAVARCEGVHQLAFSGGVFQNALLVDWLRYDLDAAYQLYFHRQLSPNDECISFGQLIRSTLQPDRFSPVQTETDYVLSHSR